MINIFQPTHQVVFLAGEGEDVSARVRAEIPTFCFARSAEHAALVKMHIIARMIGEHLDTVDEGFLFKRLLKRTRSVGGSNADSKITDAKITDAKITDAKMMDAEMQNPTDGGSTDGRHADDASFGRILAADDTDSGAVTQSEDE
jgi:hypothetical protein